MRIAIAGATGLVGTRLTSQLTQWGHDVVGLARSTGVDLVSGAGLDARMEGVDAVVDVTNVDTIKAKESRAFFGAVTTNLLAAAAKHQLGHYVALSIVGADRVDFGYYLGKRLQEELIAAGPVPWSLVRSTQFHEFPDQLLASQGRIALIPTMKSQPVAVDEVVGVLADRVVSRPLGRTPGIAGPQVESMPDLVRQRVRQRGLKTAVIPVRLPGKIGKAMSTGGLLPTESDLLVGTTWGEWLAAQS